MQLSSGWYYEHFDVKEGTLPFPIRFYLDSFGRPIVVDMALGAWERKIVSIQYPTEHSEDPTARVELPNRVLHLSVRPDRLNLGQLDVSEVVEGEAPASERTIYVAPNTRAVGPRGTRISYGTDRSKWPSEILPFVRNER